jgi:hypothetical protein
MKKKKTAARQTVSKVYLLRVYFDDYDDLYADIEASDTMTYEQLHDAIFEAFKRWEEHLYMFSLPDGTQVLSPYDVLEDGNKPADRCRLGKVLSVGETIYYLFDFGDTWQHSIEVRGIKEPEAKVNYPHILEVHGDVPPQYPEEEDFDEDEDNDEFEDDAPENGK